VPPFHRYDRCIHDAPRAAVLAPASPTAKLPTRHPSSNSTAERIRSPSQLNIHGARPCARQRHTASRPRWPPQNWWPSPATADNSAPQKQGTNWARPTPASPPRIGMNDVSSW